MNCQDISRLVDSGKFSTLSPTERREANAHALSCRHCAPVWAAHAQLAEQRLPPMPAELATRVRMLAALPAPATGARTWRRLTVVGCVVALAAAASILMLRLSDTRLPESDLSVVAISPPPKTAQARAMPNSTTPIVSNVVPVQATVAEPQPAKLQLSATLPLLFPPAPRDLTPTIDAALEKAVQLYPDLVDGPDVDDTFFVVIVMRANGSVISSAAQLANPEETREISAAHKRMIPTDGGIQITAMRARNSPVPDGRRLRANTTLRIGVVPDTYDLSRSNMKVDQLVRDRYAALMRPMRNGELDQLTIFLREDGKVAYEALGTIRAEDVKDAGESGNATSVAERISAQLGIDVGQIGLTGVMSVEDDSAAILQDTNGIARPDDQQSRVVVFYAWPRLSGESAPSIRQSGETIPLKPTFDTAAALTIVDRLIPDAFTLDRSIAGTPVVVLNSKGEAVGAVRVNIRDKVVAAGRGTLRELEQVAPGFGSRPTTFNTQVLTDRNGATAEITFAWVDWADAAPIPVVTQPRQVLLDVIIKADDKAIEWSDVQRHLAVASGASTEIKVDKKLMVVLTPMVLESSQQGPDTQILLSGQLYGYGEGKFELLSSPRYVVTSGAKTDFPLKLATNEVLTVSVTATEQ